METQIEIAIKASRKIESLLEKILGARGKGLHEKISSVENYLSSETVNRLRRIASIRNKLVHEDGYRIKDMREFISDVKNAIKVISSSPVHSSKINVNDYVKPKHFVLQIDLANPPTSEEIIIKKRNLETLAGEESQKRKKYWMVSLKSISSIFIIAMQMHFFLDWEFSMWSWIYSPLFILGCIILYFILYISIESMVEMTPEGALIVEEQLDRLNEVSDLDYMTTTFKDICIKNEIINSYTKKVGQMGRRLTVDEVDTLEHFNEWVFTQRKMFEMDDLYGKNLRA